MSCVYIRTMVICVHIIILALLCALGLVVLPFEAFDRPGEIGGTAEEGMLAI